MAAQIQQRPGGLAQALLSYQAAIAPVAERYQASARSMLAVMLLAAGVGATIRLETQGPDEAEAMTAMVELIAGRFGEQR